MTRSLRRLLLPLVVLSRLASRGVGLDAGGVSPPLSLPPPPPRLALPGGAAPVPEEDWPVLSTDVVAAAAPEKKPGDLLVLPRPLRPEPSNIVSSDSGDLPRDVVAGLAHLHRLGIIHRDLKPHNVLISTEGGIRAKLSDMGISKCLQEDTTSISHHGTGIGSSGWQAPEQLRRTRQTRALDLFSLGCLIFYCITKGKHPFGEYYERDINILNNHFDLFVVDYIPEAVHLLSQLLQPNPEMRPSAVYVMHHPLFWSPELCLSFLRDTSDRIDKTSETDLINALESIGPIAFGGKWGDKLDPVLITDMGRYRKYNFESIRDLLRYIRNKSGHYRELSDDLKAMLGSLSEGFYRYFASRFPRLLIEVYKVMSVHCKDEEAFSKYFKRSSV